MAENSAWNRCCGLPNKAFNVGLPFLIIIWNVYLPVMGYPFTGLGLTSTLDSERIHFPIFLEMSHMKERCHSHPNLKRDNNAIAADSA